MALCGYDSAINVICTLLTPIAAKWHYAAMIAMRIGEGIGGGVTFPAMHVMLAHWAPPAERSVMSSIVYSGSALGTVISMLMAGVIAGSLGWEAVFYIMGGLSVIWIILWIVLVSDNPEKSSLVSEEEKNLIVGALRAEVGGTPKQEHPPVPWKSIFLSTAFWAILVAHTCSNWGWYMVLIELPLYMKMILQFKIAENAVLTAVPFLCMWIFSILLSKTLDTLRAKNIISTTFARKTATLTASIVPTVCFVALCYIGCQRSLSVFLMTIAIMSIGGMYCGFLSNHIDIAPNYAGTLMAITNTVATIPGIVVPVFVGNLTLISIEICLHAEPVIIFFMFAANNMNSWKIIFWVTAGLYLIEILIYALFGSGDVQEWNNTTNQNVEVQPLRSPQSPDSTKQGKRNSKEN
ncbi:Major Facilitator Superfamily [Popillia japonica]|uniref:Major Facilitator Superfamily n=1 Tax=Popillia japonica TaxID=7064 RepID=A0AAW1KLF1_POPJA